MAYVPRDYQVETVNKTVDYIENGGKAGLICLPTGTGKSVIPAMLLIKLFRDRPYLRAMLLTHRKTLISQNYAKLKELFPEAPCGVYSAGLSKRESEYQITYAGIQSVAKKADLFGHIDLVIIDEAHLTSPNDETQYKTFLAALRMKNPKLVIVGMTATDFRLDTGPLLGGGIYEDVIVDKTKGDDFVWFIDQGYLVPVHANDTDSRMDTTGIKTRGQEFVLADLEKRFNRTDVSEKIVSEVLRRRGNHKVGITFAMSIEHAEELKELYCQIGIPSVTTHSKLSDEIVSQNILDFENGKYEMIVDVERHTTGYDYNKIDLIVDARPSESAALVIQMKGRGTRPVYASGYDLTTQEGRLAAIAASCKPNGCLCLDFAGNTLRLGPINDPIINPRERERAADGSVLSPVKCCQGCRTFVHAAVRTCPNCTYVFPVGEEISMSGEVIAGLLIKRDGLREERLFDVTSFTASFSRSYSGRPSALLTFVLKGVKKPVYKHLYMTQAALRFNRSFWKILLPFGPDFPYDPSKTESENVIYVCEYLNQSFRPKKARVWVNYVNEKKEVEPKILEVA